MVRVAFSRADLDSGVGVVVDMFLRAVSRTKGGCGNSEHVSRWAIVQQGQAYTCAVEMNWADNLLQTMRPEDAV